MHTDVQLTLIQVFPVLQMAQPVPRSKYSKQVKVRQFPPNPWLIAECTLDVAVCVNCETCHLIGINPAWRARTTLQNISGECNAHKRNRFLIVFLVNSWHHTQITRQNVERHTQIHSSAPSMDSNINPRDAYCRSDSKFEKEFTRDCQQECVCGCCSRCFE
jgi:hypothetical protein